eukprot:CAMPEP_0119411872 /NCGR_PEP_ID=MMETSP1335-20130426/4468_1 /TAXON_ID=259385 /ORGANISM="Chrysoculter rhomboideus, Strain RCC1486" /LENGTH=149 /DNA_ID=CAMNT_0007436545 /DNA_START=228 /DNA_END=677 /DNA_ORIENTATION=-
MPLLRTSVGTAAPRSQQARSAPLSGAPVHVATRALSLLEDAEQVLVAEDEVVLVAQLDLRAAVLWKEDLIALLYAHGDELPILVAAARSHRDHLALVELAHRALGEQDAADRLWRLHPLHEDAVEQRDQTLRLRAVQRGRDVVGGTPLA